jgi:endonuclease I
MMVLRVFRFSKRRIFRICLSICIVACAILSEQAAAQWDEPPGYYSGATGTGPTLKNQLTSIMSAGHIQRQYGNFRFSAAIHDQDPNNPSNILLVYNVASVPATWDSGATWNREHVWPQARQPGSASNNSQGNLGDPHALRPSNPDINAARENKPFGFFDTFGQYGSVGQYYFPGDTDKGEIARSLFYSDTRWTSLGLSLTDSFPTGNQMGGLSALIAWHYLETPDEFERRRNHTIYSSADNPQYFTNNRNAYVDRPEFVWSVYVNQTNDSTITIDGGVLNGGGESTLDLVFGPVIVGSSFSASQLVTLDKNGLDGTYYSVQVFEDATSNVSGFYNAFRTGTIDSATLDIGLQFDSNLPGMTDGLIVVDNLDVTTGGGTGNGSNDGDDFIDLSITVLDHANPSFSNLMDENTLLIELGDVVLGGAPAGTSISISNLAAALGAALTADLDLDSITETDPAGKFSVSGSLFDNLAAGQSQQLTLNVVADQLGSYSAFFDFNLSDEDLPGTTPQTITLFATMNVVAEVILGDANGDSVFNNLDIAAFVLALTNPVAYQAMFPDVDPDVVLDMNGDGVFDNLDIAGFVAALTGGKK